MKVLALVMFVTGMDVIAALWLILVEGLIAHALSKAKVCRMQSALMRKSKAGML